MTLPAVAILIVAVISACLSTTVKQAASPPTPPVFPTHDAPLKTNLGINYLAGELRVENGCLKLYRLGWDNPNRTVGDQLRDIWLPVWPPDFELRMDGGQGQVLDPEGESGGRGRRNRAAQRAVPLAGERQRQPAGIRPPSLSAPALDGRRRGVGDCGGRADDCAPAGVGTALPALKDVGASNKPVAGPTPRGPDADAEWALPARWQRRPSGCMVAGILPRQGGRAGGGAKRRGPHRGGHGAGHEPRQWRLLS